MDIQAKLEKILPKVENPARYMGGEANGSRKDFDEMVGTIALVFPDTYEVGMSNNGTRILYHIVNSAPDLLAELSFAPWMDMSKLMKENDVPLYTHESYTPINKFDVVGITLQTEMNYTNIPYILELSGIPAWSAERGEKDPFVVGGGPCMANPEPVADFYDLFVIGDGEVLAPTITRMIGQGRKEGKSRGELLIELSELHGVYVPSLLDVKLSDKKEWIPNLEAKGSYKNTKGVKRTWVEVLDKENYPKNNIIPNTKLVHDRFAIEVMRGCTQGCRFCQAGYWYRPNRELEPDAVVEIAKAGLGSTGEKELSLLSLSTADYSQVENVTDKLIDDDFFHNVEVSLPSLRANSFGQSLAQKVAAIKGGRSATFAPETGSERLRKVINKTITDEDMYKAAHSVFKAGFNKIKLYTMVGLPTENLADMEAFCNLIQGLYDIGLQYGAHKQIHASIGILVPKPFTPMQWSGFMEREKVMSHIYFVKERFYRNKGVRITWTGWEEAHIETFFSRGDRSQSAMIYEAYQEGQVFESHSENHNYRLWTSLWEKYGYDQNRMFGERSFDEVFPWDFIHAGTSKPYLKAEYQKMYLTDTDFVYDCKWSKDDCNKCGVPGNYEDIQLANDPEVKAPNRSPDEVRELFQSRKDERPEKYRYMLVFEKRGLSKFLPHQNTMNFIERAFHRLKVPMNYSKGFSPRPKISNKGALPLGLETFCEELMVEFLEALPTVEVEEFLEKLNKIFPKGMKITKYTLHEEKKMPTPLTTLYHFDGEYRPEALELYKKGELPNVVNHRGKEIAIQPQLAEVYEADNKLYARAYVNISGTTISPFLIFASLLDVSLEDVRQLNMSKVSMSYE